MEERVEAFRAKHPTLTFTVNGSSSDDDESVVDEDQDILDVGNIEDVLGDGCDLC